MKYHINEETVFRKVVTTSGHSYIGTFYLTQFGNVILATNGNYVIPLSSVKYMTKELGCGETRRCRKPRIYKPEPDAAGN